MPRVDIPEELSNMLKDRWKKKHPYRTISLTQIVIDVIDMYVRVSEQNG